MSVNSSHDDGGESGVWLRVRILNSLVFSFRTTVRAIRGSLREANQSFSASHRIIGSVSSNSTSFSKVSSTDGMARLRKLADWLEQEQPAAANSLRKGLEECFTINRLGIPPSLHRCLATTNLIESPQSGVRMRTRRVCRWRDTAMVARWAAASFLATGKNLRPHHGLKRSLATGSDLGKKNDGNCCVPAGGRVT
jgi:hypothetical protein